MKCLCDKCKHADGCPAKAEHGGAIRCSAFKPMTNEEWFAGLSTEEKARFLDKICYSAWGDKNSRFKDMADYTDWLEWLKEIHE